MTNQVQNTPLQFQGGGTPGDASNTAQPGQQSGGEQRTDSGATYLTAEDASKLFESLFDRKAQSITDRTASRVQKVLQAAQGVQLSAQQAQTLLDSMDNQPAQAQPQQTQAQPSRQAQPQGQQPAQPGVHWALQGAIEYAAAAGVEVNNDDPEVKLIKQTDNPMEFLRSVQEAVDAKKAWLSKAGDPARMPSLGGAGRQANDIQSIKDPNEL